LGKSSGSTAAGIGVGVGAAGGPACSVIAGGAVPATDGEGDSSLGGRISRSPDATSPGDRSPGPEIAFHVDVKTNTAAIVTTTCKLVESRSAQVHRLNDCGLCIFSRSEGHEARAKCSDRRGALQQEHDLWLAPTLTLRVNDNCGAEVASVAGAEFPGLRERRVASKLDNTVAAGTVPFALRARE
jgi:hypothetical protein